MGIKVKVATVTPFWIREQGLAPDEVAGLNQMLHSDAETLSRAKAVTSDVVVVPYDVATRIAGNCLMAGNTETYVLCVTRFDPRVWDGVVPFTERGKRVYLTRNPGAVLPPALQSERDRFQWWPVSTSRLVKFTNDAANTVRFLARGPKNPKARPRRRGIMDAVLCPPSGSNLQLVAGAHRAARGAGSN